MVDAQSLERPSEPALVEIQGVLGCVVGEQKLKAAQYFFADGFGIAQPAVWYLPDQDGFATHEQRGHEHGRPHSPANRPAAEA